MHEHGIQDRENSLLYTKKPKCSAGSGAQFVSVGIIDIEPALYLIAWGFGISICVFVIEVASIHFKRNVHAIKSRKFIGKKTKRIQHFK